MLETKPELDESADLGLVEEFIQAVLPATEASRPALIAQLLAAFGNCIGRSAYWKIGPQRHYLNLYVVLVGKSSRSRKGTALAWVEDILKGADGSWLEQSKRSGIATAEGLIDLIHDSQAAKSDKEKDDPGIPDKRLLVVEQEFAALLGRAERQGNTLSEYLRDLWDCPPFIETVARGKKVRATEPHVSCVAHITEKELKATLTATAQANGFGNRFLRIWTECSKLLPFGGDLHPADREALIARFKGAVEFAKGVGEMCMDEEATDWWPELYEEVRSDKPGLSRRTKVL
jgi:hypothetical protein